MDWLVDIGLENSGPLNIGVVHGVNNSGDTQQIFLSRVSTSEYRQPPSIRRVFQTNAHR